MATSLGNVFMSDGGIAPSKQSVKKTILSAFTGLDLTMNSSSSTAPIVSAAAQRLALKQAAEAEANVRSGPFIFPKMKAPVMETAFTQALDSFDSEIATLAVGDRRAKAKTIKSSKAARRKSKLAERAESYEGRMGHKAARKSKRKQRRERLKNVY